METEWDGDNQRLCSTRFQHEFPCLRGAFCDLSATIIGNDLSPQFGRQEPFGSSFVLRRSLSNIGHCSIKSYYYSLESIDRLDSQQLQYWSTDQELKR